VKPGHPHYDSLVRFEQAQALRMAYVALAAGNHDYAGKRVQAMHAIREGIRDLDAFVLKNGTGPLKQATRRGEAAIARAGNRSRKAGAINEPQAVSDVLLRDAAGIVGLVRPSLAGDKQHDVLRHVDAALRDVNVALKVN
jgi:hypothetical protein